MNRIVFSLALAATLGLAGTAWADPLQSGPQPGQKVPGPFHPLNVTGPDAGKRECLYCKNGMRPAAMIFVREGAPCLDVLLRKLDAVAASHQDPPLGSFCIVLGSDPALPAAIKQWAEQEHLQKTILAVDAPAGPPSYKIAADADVTVLLYNHCVVKANFALRKGELTDKAVDAVLAELAKMLAAD